MKRLLDKVDAQLSTSKNGMSYGLNGSAWYRFTWLSPFRLRE